MLCCKCNETKALMAAALPRKKVTKWKVNHVVDLMIGLEHYKVAIKADKTRQKTDQLGV